MAYDKPGWAKRIEALERVRDDMKANVLSTQYLHNTRHYTGGDDPLTPANIGAANKKHSHIMSDITDLDSISISPGNIDLGALVDALKPLMGSGGVIALQGFNAVNTASDNKYTEYVNKVYCPVNGRIIQVSFIQHAAAGAANKITFYNSSSLIAKWSIALPKYIPEQAHQNVNSNVSIGSILSVEYKLSQFGGGSDNYAQGQCNWCMLIEKTG
jgi:hypothetical protein